MKPVRGVILRRRYLSGLLATFCILVGAGALDCQGLAGEQTCEVTFEQLLTDPTQYHGRQITLEGFYFQGFEVVVLSEGLEPSGYAEGHLIPKGRMLWIEGGIPLEIYNRLQEQEMMGPEEHYGKLKVTGGFEYGGQYGHLGGHDAQITPSEVELLPWSP
jgi:hypothetical protein